MKKTLKLILLAALVGSACLYTCKTKPPATVKIDNDTTVVAETPASTINNDSIGTAVSENITNRIKQKIKNDTVATTEKSIETLPIDSINKLNQEYKIENIIIGQELNPLYDYRKYFYDGEGVLQFTSGITTSVYYQKFAISPNNKSVVLPSSLGLNVYMANGKKTNTTFNIMYTSGYYIADDGRFAAFECPSEFELFKTSLVFYGTNGEVIKRYNEKFGGRQFGCFSKDGNYLFVVGQINTLASLRPEVVRMVLFDFNFNMLSKKVIVFPERIFLCHIKISDNSEQFIIYTESSYEKNPHSGRKTFYYDLNFNLTKTEKGWTE